MVLRQTDPMPFAKRTASFIPPMLLLKTERLPDGDAWVHELKMDGYRAIAFKTGGKLYLRSRNDNDFSVRYPGVVKGLAKLPDETVIDGEVVAFDEEGRPSFNALQNYGSAPGPVVFYVFDVMVLAGRNLQGEHARRPARVAREEGATQAERSRCAIYRRSTLPCRT